MNGDSVRYLFLLTLMITSTTLYASDFKCGVITNVLDHIYGPTFFIKVSLEENNKTQNILMIEAFLEKRAAFYKRSAFEELTNLKISLMEAKELGGSACLDTEGRIVISTTDHARAIFKKMYPELI